MTATPYFSGVERDKSHREEARRVARTLAKTNPSLGYDLLYSAASYLLRDAQQSRDSAVITEARRRKAHVEQACEAHRNRTKREAPGDESPFAEIAKGGS